MIIHTSEQIKNPKAEPVGYEMNSLRSHLCRVRGSVYLNPFVSLSTDRQARFGNTCDYVTGISQLVAK